MDFKVTLVDSSNTTRLTLLEMAFKITGSMAIKEAFARAAASCLSR